MYQVLRNLGFWWSDRKVKVWGSEHLGEYCPTDKVYIVSMDATLMSGTLSYWLVRHRSGNMWRLTGYIQFSVIYGL